MGNLNEAGTAREAGNVKSPVQWYGRGQTTDLLLEMRDSALPKRVAVLAQGV